MRVTSMLTSVKVVWKNIRRLSGDDAYEQYLQHYQHHHSVLCDADTLKSEAPRLSRAEFFKQWQDQKWTGIKRCC